MPKNSMMIHNPWPIGMGNAIRGLEGLPRGFKYKIETINNSPMGKMKLYSLYYSEEEYIMKENSVDDEEFYEQLLERKVFIDVPEDKLLSVYIVNPDYYIIFGDLITEVLSCIKEWRTTFFKTLILRQT